MCKSVCRSLFLAAFLSFSLLIPAHSEAELLPEIKNSTKVCLQTWMGTYVCAEAGGGGLVVANRRKPGAWETFKLRRIDADHVSLQTEDGHYLCAEKGGGFNVVANRDSVGEWETFQLEINPNNGLCALRTSNGHYLVAEEHGLVQANRKEIGEWEHFRICHPVLAEDEQYQVTVNVYKIGSAPFWHTGTVIDGREYYFQTSNRVESCDPRGMALKHHRTITRLVPGDAKGAKAALERVEKEWNGTRYDVAGHNCNFFTHALLDELGTTGLDREYLDASGVAIAWRQIPGSSSLQEAIVKWPLKDKREEEAFMDDLEKLKRLPLDIERELRIHFRDSVLEDISKKGKEVGGKISSGAKRVLGFK